MTATLLATRSSQLVRRAEAAVGAGLIVITPEQLPAAPAQVLAIANGSGPVGTLIIDPPSGREDDALALAGRMAAQFPHVSVMLITDRALELGLAALRSGVTDLLESDVSVEDLRWALHRVRTSAAARNPDETDAGRASTGRVITVASPKGGVGKTTLSTNLAVGLAGLSHKNVVLVDLDVQFGDVAAGLNLDPEYTLADVVDGPAAQDVMVMKSYLAEHTSGLYVLCGVKSPHEADSVSTNHIGHLIDQLKREFKYVVLDTAPGMTEQTLAALDQTSDLVLVTSMDVPGVRGLRKELDLLDELDLEATTRHVVLNFADRSGGLSLKDVEATLQRSVDVVIPRHKSVTMSTNQGIPLLQSGGRDRISRTLQSLVERFAPAHSSAAKSRWSGRHRRMSS